MYKLPFWRTALLKAKWSTWNPWCIGRLNLAWTKYTQTVMYAERKKLEEEHPRSFKNFAMKSYMDNCETLHFIKRFTFGEKVKLTFAPFSFGSTFKMPFYKLESLIFGKQEE